MESLCDSIGGPKPLAGEVADSYRFSLELEHRLDRIRHCTPLLEALAKQAIEPNVFAEPWMIFPALENYTANCRMVFILLYATSRVNGNVELCGFIPLEIKARYRGVPIQHVALWRYPHCYLSTPLLHRDFATQSLQLLIDWFLDNRRYHLMVFNQVSADGSFGKALRYVLAGSPVKYFEKPFTRAYFRPGEEFKSYLNEAISRSSIKNFDRLRRRLAESGAVTWATLATNGDPGSWIDEFLRLESSGWKGMAGTALQETSADSAFFRHIAGEAFLRQRLLMIMLRVDGMAIAMVVVFLTENGGFAFKMAYREKYGKYSPGALVLLELNRQLHLRKGFQWLDSCANPESSIANRLWKDRKKLGNFVISKSRTVSALLVGLLPSISHIKKSIAHMFQANRIAASFWKFIPGTKRAL